MCYVPGVSALQTASRRNANVGKRRQATSDHSDPHPIGTRKGEKRPGMHKNLDPGTAAVVGNVLSPEGMRPHWVFAYRVQQTDWHLKLDIPCFWMIVRRPAWDCDSNFLPHWGVETAGRWSEACFSNGIWMSPLVVWASHNTVSSGANAQALPEVCLPPLVFIERTNLRRVDRWVDSMSETKKKSISGYTVKSEHW